MPILENPKTAAPAEGPKVKRLSIADVLILAAITIASLGLMGYFFRQSATIMGPVDMGIHGWIALGLGVVLSMALGIGLMVLVFLSARRGFDDRIEVENPDEH
ncbi:MAG: hypothetical protein ABWZ40_11170 [Caulobacterales bacterium]